jgi:hypothetical protein
LRGLDFDQVPLPADLGLRALPACRRTRTVIHADRRRRRPVRRVKSPGSLPCGRSEELPGPLSQPPQLVPAPLLPRLPTAARSTQSDTRGRPALSRPSRRRVRTCTTADDRAVRGRRRCRSWTTTQICSA